MSETLEFEGEKVRAGATVGPRAVSQHNGRKREPRMVMREAPQTCRSSYYCTLTDADLPEHVTCRRSFNPLGCPQESRSSHDGANGLHALHDTRPESGCPLNDDVAVVKRPPTSMPSAAARNLDSASGQRRSRTVNPEVEALSDERLPQTTQKVALKEKLAEGYHERICADSGIAVLGSSS